MMTESSDDVDSGSESLESLMFRFSLPQFVYAVPHHALNAARVLACTSLNAALGNSSEALPSRPAAEPRGNRLPGSLGHAHTGDL